MKRLALAAVLALAACKPQTSKPLDPAAVHGQVISARTWTTSAGRVAEYELTVQTAGGPVKVRLGSAKFRACRAWGSKYPACLPTS